MPAYGAKPHFNDPLRPLPRLRTTPSRPMLQCAQADHNDADDDQDTDHTDDQMLMMIHDTDDDGSGHDSDDDTSY